MKKLVKTTNRKLENYLYALGIKPLESNVLWDGMVQWTYEHNDAFLRAFETYRQMKKDAARYNRGLLRF